MNPKPASKNQIRNRKKLLSGKYRKKEGLFLAEGVRCVEQILENGVIEVVELLVEEGFKEISFADGRSPVFTLTADEFASVSDTENPQGVIAVCRTPEEASIDQITESSGLIAVFDAVQDPGNLGTMIRTASWFGVSAMVFGTGTADSFHPKVVRSTAGATGAAPYLRGDLKVILDQLEKAGRSIYLLDGSDSSVDLVSVKPGGKEVLVVGNEANGIDTLLFGKKRTLVRIDGESRYVESLNAAVALSIGLFYFSSGD